MQIEKATPVQNWSRLSELVQETIHRLADVTTDPGQVGHIEELVIQMQDVAGKLDLWNPPLERCVYVRPGFEIDGVAVKGEGRALSMFAEARNQPDILGMNAFRLHDPADRAPARMGVVDFIGGVLVAAGENMAPTTYGLRLTTRQKIIDVLRTWLRFIAARVAEAKAVAAMPADDALLSVAEIARLTKLPRGVVAKRLERLRMKNPDCAVKCADKRRNLPGYVYIWGLVKGEFPEANVNGQSHGNK